MMFPFLRNTVARRALTTCPSPVSIILIDTYLEENGYAVADSANVENYFLKADDYKIRIEQDMPVLAVSLSDFNAILRLDGREPIALPDGGFFVAWENTALPDEIRQFEKEHPNIQVGKNTFSKVPGADYQVDIGTGLFANKKKAVYILPDAVCDTLTLATSDYNVNTTQPLSHDFAEKMEQRFKIIGNLGIDQRQIGSIIRRQMLIWFGFPVLVAFFGAGAALFYLAMKNYQDYIPYISMNQVLINISEVYGIFLLILICYFTATYSLFKRNIAE